MGHRNNRQHVDIASLTAETQGFSPPRLLAWAAERFARQVAFATSLGVEDQALTDMIARAAPSIAVFTIDTGRLHPQTLELVRTTRQRCGLEIQVLCPDPEEVAQMVREHGADLFYSSIDNRRLCCHVRKVNVLRRRLAGLGAWVCGLRREQSVTREAVQTIQWDQANGLVKINPLADWTIAQVWDYVRDHDVPYNPLHDEGYPSIGCQPCTRAVEPGQDIRSGRWWWESPEHKECGLHVVDGRLVRKTR